MTVEINGSGYISGITRLDTRLSVVGSTINLDQASVFKKTVNSNIEFNVANAPVSDQPISFELYITNGGNYTVTFWSGVVWENGVVPVLSTQTDVLKFTTSDGGVTWTGYVVESNIRFGEEYWIAILGGANTNDYGWDIAVDSSGNVYVTGETESPSTGWYDAFIAKYSSSGTLQWQRTLGGASGDYGYGIALDSSGNVYVTGITASQGAGGDDVLIAKYNTSGTLQWQRVLGGASADYGNDIAVDSSGNVYVTGGTGSQGAGNGDVLIAKYDTSGTLQWQRTLGGANTDYGYGIAVDSSGNVYVNGQTFSQGAGGGDVLIAKYDTSGTLQWQRILGGANTDVGFGIAVDSSGNIYITGRTNSQGVGNYDGLIAKYNTSGTLQWQRVLGVIGNDELASIAVDSSGNVYIAGNADGEIQRDALIVKYNTSGTLQWQRTLIRDGFDYLVGIAVDSSDNVYVTGGSENSNLYYDTLIAKLPGDGSLTGTYGNLTYQPSTLTDAASTLTAATSTLTAATSTLTSSTSTLTSSISSLPASTINI